MRRELASTEPVRAPITAAIRLSVVRCKNVHFKNNLRIFIVGKYGVDLKTTLCFSITAVVYFKAAARAM